MTAEIVALTESAADSSTHLPSRQHNGPVHLRLVPPPERPALRDPLLCALAAGDELAWRDTVVRYERLARFAARGVVRSASDIDEAVARTWEKLLRHASQIRDSQRLAGWLATTARREALALARDRQRQEPVTGLSDAADPAAPEIDAHLLQDELSAALEAAVDALPPQQRVVIRALLDGAETYAELSAQLGIPHGSIGPTRMRAIAELRRRLVPRFG